MLNGCKVISVYIKYFLLGYSLCEFDLLFWLKGEEQKKLDVLSNEVFVKALVSSGRTVSHHISFYS